MKIITAKKGDLYECVEMDIRALLNNKVGDKFLDKNNAFKIDTEIVFVKKRDSQSKEGLKLLNKDISEGCHL